MDNVKGPKRSINRYIAKIQLKNVRKDPQKRPRMAHIVTIIYLCQFMFRENIRNHLDLVKT